MKVFLDMDGVVVDFVGGALELHGRKWPYKKCRGDKAWDLPKILGMTADEFYADMDEQFWAQLNMTAEADEIVATCRCWADELYFLSSASGPQGCLQGKRDWVDEYYPHIPLITVTTSGQLPPKWACASHDAVLVDDCSQNVDLFRDHGGFAMLISRPWNRDWHHEHDNVARLSNYLESFSK